MLWLLCLFLRFFCFSSQHWVRHVGHMDNDKGAPMNLLLIIIVLFLLFGGGFGTYHAWGNYGPAYGGGIGIGTILVILLVVWLLGGLRS